MSPPPKQRVAPLAVALIGAIALLVSAACEAGPPPPTPLIVPGSAGAPREVNVVMKDWLFLPDPVDVVPGETVLLHVVNGGLVVHEVVLGDPRVQDAWEAAEAAAADAPPGPTPLVTVEPDVAGIRIVVQSGQRVDFVWTVPADAAAVRTLALGCHIPGHWEKGMRATIRLAGTGA